ncbi:MAG TPA: NYN domain-containing protein, partial [Patescibacteria group bacterium]|nr:NYN domain-containing protein [Patescibacteria group bacterium]
YYAARGQDVDIDYVALLKHATKGRDLIRAYAYTGLDPENENQRKFIDFLAKNGYKPVIKDIRKFGDGRMKANLDIELVVDLFRLADRMDIAVIASGDGDFAPAIKALQDKGVRCEVISFKPNTSSDLIAVADEFQDIMKIASISRKKGEGSREASTSMPTPEMPAKEVNPEFGFREASPSVAAAALAALKGGSAGTSTGNGRRTRGGTGRRTAAPAAAAEPALAEEAPERAVASPAETLAEGDEQARRRRRRRGGRGRGRSRREEEDGAELTPAAAGTEEVGWEEFDDLSQIDGVEDAREYTFEEADAATLAELGLSADDLQAAPAEEEKPKRRSTRTSSRARKAAEDAEAPPAEPKPRARRSTRSRSSEEQAPAPADSDEPQGIWGRFRSARKPRGAAE